MPETTEAPRVQGFLDDGARGTRTPDLLGAIQFPALPSGIQRPLIWLYPVDFVAAVFGTWLP
jgi:hypothetical protein